MSDERSQAKAIRALTRELREISEQLLAQGWLVRSARVERSNGDVVVSLDHGTLRVWLLHDRGDPMIELAPPAWPLSFLPSEWREAISGDTMAYALPLADQIKLLKEDVGEVARALADHTITLERMREIRARNLKEMPVPWR